MKKIKYLFLLSASAALILAGCEVTELDLQTDPNNLSIGQADPDFVLNDIQLDFNSIYGGYNAPSRDIMRMENQFGPYFDVVDNLTLDGANGEWAASYRMFNNVDLLSQIADENDLFVHKGIAQVLKAYTYIMLVDYLGEVPFSEANQPLEFPNPAVDTGDVIYDAMFDLIDEAIDNLDNGQQFPPNDLYYGGDASKWITLANTLKLKMYVTSRLANSSESADGIEDIIDSGDFIDEIDEDFQFKFSANGPPVESRHPFFQSGYLPGGASTYQSNSFIFMLKDEKPFEDPRLPYYLYRQADRDPEGQELPCDGNPIYDFCYVGDFYWGRDHTDPEGLPGDGGLRTTYGVYPGGGAYDEGQAIVGPATNNAGGAGIRPIFLSSFTHFLLAESSLTLGTSGDTEDLFEQAMRLSFDKVSGFLGSPEMDDDAIDDYVDFVMDEYDDDDNDDADRLAIIMREYYLAAFGNSVEPYNNYRRTGFPDLQEPILPAGPFPRTFRYPINAVQNNSSIDQKDLTDQVFWDTNPANFID